VVSDRGEQWSPNTPPPAEAATVAKTSDDTCPPLNAKANGTETGMMMAKVPQDVPVAKLTKALMKKTRSGKMSGLSQPLLTSITYGAVPISRLTVFMA